jgi:hypothetical protein
VPCEPPTPEPLVVPAPPVDPVEDDPAAPPVARPPAPLVDDPPDPPVAVLDGGDVDASSPPQPTQSAATTPMPTIHAPKMRCEEPRFIVLLRSRRRRSVSRELGGQRKLRIC